jgi:hypothetical protein
MEVSTSDISPPAKARKPSPLSYKFQRLREKIRAAINSGELTGKLPGERELAKRFHCNAKTLSKALTDLAAEGVLDRQIGRGTYVKGTREVESQRRGPWLILCNDAQASSPIIAELRRVNPDARISTDEPSLRPSFVTQFTGFVDFTGNAPADFLRDTIVRNIPLVLVGHEPKTYSTHAVIIDQTLGASNLFRDMLLAGHRRLLAVEERGETTLANAMRQTAARYATDATVDPCFAEEVPAAIEYGATAVLCASDDLAQAVFASLARSSRPADGVAVAQHGRRVRGRRAPLHRLFRGNKRDGRCDHAPAAAPADLPPDDPVADPHLHRSRHAGRARHAPRPDRIGRRVDASGGRRIAGVIA